MLYFILSDIHGNLEALVEVLKDIVVDSRINIETRNKLLTGLDYVGIKKKRDKLPLSTNRQSKIISLGDIIGYGARPNECVEIVKKVADISVLGNHEDILFDLEERALSQEIIQQRLIWTERQLSPENKKYLEDLYREEQFIYQEEYLTFSHGVPTSPRQFHYNKNAEVAQWFKDQNFGGKVSFIGHCHAVYFFGNLRNQFVKYQLDNIAFPFKLKGYQKILLSVPSVGQPRDRNPKTGYLIYDSESRLVQIRRIDYNFSVTKEEIIAAGLPRAYALRLGKGL